MKKLGYCLFFLLFSLKLIAQTDSKTADVLGLITPIQLTGDQTTVVLEDYFMDVSKVKNVFAAAPLKSFLAKDKKTVLLRGGKNVPLFSLVMVLMNDGSKYDILVKASQKKPITIKLADNGYKSVAVKGDFNAWNVNDGMMKKNGSTWEATINMNAGDYEYMFVTDGKEVKDPLSKLSSANGKNALLSLPKPDIKKLTHLFTEKNKGREFSIGFDNEPAKVFAFWNNQKLAAGINKVNKNLECIIPDAAKAEKRSFIRAFAFNTEGVANDILIPLEFGKIVESTTSLSRTDKEAQIMYFILLDRFKNGSLKNDNPDLNPKIHPMANWQGGDIAGMTEKINDGYLKTLNINSLWISPITKNPDSSYQEYPEPHRWYTGYHGYWPTLSSFIDPHFGTDNDMKTFVDAAHKNGMNILLDYVCHHVHTEHPFFKANPTWITKLDLPDGRKNIRIWDEQRLTTWFDTFMPTLDLERPEVIVANTDSTLFWMKKFDLDGFRHDAAKHIPLPFWRYLTKKIKKDVISSGKSVYQIGETYGSRELIASYINSGMMDSQFDFPVYFDSREVIAKDGLSFKIVENTLRESFNYFGYHNTMGYMTGNHDQPRFISLAGGGLKWDESDREAGYQRKIEVGDPIGYKRLQMMTALMFTIPGVPVIFYGDEIGIPGAGDPDCRRMMRFEGLSDAEKENKMIAEKITTLRAKRLSLIYGDTEILKTSDDTFVFLRDYFGELTVTVFNKSRVASDVNFEVPKRFLNTNLKTNFNGKVTKSGTQISVSLAANSFEILTN